MPTPEFVLDLRRHVGHAPLWLAGVSVTVVDHDQRVLLTRRSDTGHWSMIGGIVEPGEHPAVTVVRECEEETGVTVEITGLVEIRVDPAVHYPNGDVVQYLTHAFVCRHVSGEARVADDESLEVGWFALDALPDLPASQVDRLHAALAFDGVTRLTH